MVGIEGEGGEIDEQLQGMYTAMKDMTDAVAAIGGGH